MTPLEALDKELKSWIGTPYVPGQAMKGPRGGVDCRYFVCMVLDNLYGTHAKLPARVAKDTGLHNRDKAREALDALVKRWPNEVIDPTASLLPGDVIAVRAGGLNAASHALIVGADGKRLWHSTYGAGVCFTSKPEIAATIVGIYRPLEQSRWIR